MNESSDNIETTLRVEVLKPSRLVKRYLAARGEIWLEGRDCDYALLVVAGLSLFAAVSLVLTAGYHGAFMALHHSGRAVFSADTWANITFLGDAASALALAALFSARYPQLVQATLIAAIVSTVLVHAAKIGVDTLRPPAVLGADVIDVIGPAFKKQSFPSGHTATAFVMAGLLTRAVRGWYNRAAVIGLAILIGWSRVVVGVHWPVDVMAGAVIGLVSAWVGLRVSDRIRLRSGTYMSISGVLLASCGYLLFHHGKFEATEMTAPVLGAICALFWAGHWSLIFAQNRKSVTVETASID